MVGVGVAVGASGPSRVQRVCAAAVGVVVVAVAIVLLSRVSSTIGAVGWGMAIAGVWATLITGGIRAFVGLLRLSGLTRWAPGLGPLYVSLGVLAVGVLSVVLLQVVVPAALPGDDLAPAEQLRYLHDSDQADRKSMRFASGAARDAQRRARVLELAEAGVIRTPLDHYHAGLVLHHGVAPAHYRRAHRYVVVAAQAGLGRGEWLRKASYDRWMASLGRPQRYGTQSAATVEHLERLRQARTGR